MSSSQSDSFQQAKAACEAGDAEELARIAAEHSTLSVEDVVEAAAGKVREALLHDGVCAEDVFQLQLDDALVMAAALGDMRVVDTLIVRGARISGRDRWGQTALHVACHTDGLEIVRALVERGASAAEYDWQFVATPVGWAEQAGRADIAAYLLANAPLDPVDAIQWERLDVLRAAVKKTPALVDGPEYEVAPWVDNVLRKHHNGRAHPARQGVRLGDPLRMAARTRSMEAATWLLANGARPDLNEPRTGTFELSSLVMGALAWAIRAEAADVEKALRNAGATLDLRGAAAIGDAGIVRDQLAIAEPEEKSDSLFLACVRGHVEVATMLISAGAEVDRIAPFDQQMRTPLGAAISVEGTIELQTALVNGGADPDREELFGKTPREAMNRA